MRSDGGLPVRPHAEGYDQGDKKHMGTPIKGGTRGSILGPLLFNVFINDLFFFMDKCTLYNYADDNSISFSSDDISIVCSNIVNDAKNAINWFELNGMKANPDKFQFMIMSKESYVGHEICIDENVTISSEKCVKLLGVTIDHKLNFGDHITVTCKKAALQLNALSRISSYIQPNVRMLIYKSFINSNFQYCP